jgi:hypothetical protein
VDHLIAARQQVTDRAGVEVVGPAVRHAQRRDADSGLCVAEALVQRIAGSEEAAHRTAARDDRGTGGVDRRRRASHDRCRDPTSL